MTQTAPSLSARAVDTLVSTHCNLVTTVTSNSEPATKAYLAPASTPTGARAPVTPVTMSRGPVSTPTGARAPVTSVTRSRGPVVPATRSHGPVSTPMESRGRMSASLNKDNRAEVMFTSVPTCKSGQTAVLTRTGDVFTSDGLQSSICSDISSGYTTDNHYLSGSSVLSAVTSGYTGVFRQSTSDVTNISDSRIARVFADVGYQQACTGFMGDSYHTGIPSSHRSPAKLQFAPVRPDLYRDIAGQRGVSAACRSEPLSARRVPAKYQLATVIPGFYKSCADSEDVSAGLRRSVPSSARRAPINFQLPSVSPSRNAEFISYEDVYIGNHQSQSSSARRVPVHSKFIPVNPGHMADFTGYEDVLTGSHRSIPSSAHRLPVNSQFPAILGMQAEFTGQGVDSTGHHRQEPPLHSQDAGFSISTGHTRPI